VRSCWVWCTLRRSLARSLCAELMQSLSVESDFLGMFTG
jgi:hypothetical protein